MRCLLLGIFLITSLDAVSAQRFLREGFSNQMDSDFKAETQLDENEAMQGMTREMFLMQDQEWELQPPQLEMENPALQHHIQKYLKKPLQLRLMKRKGKYGLRAVGRMQDGKKVRAFWRQGVAKQIKASDFLEVPYDEAVRSRLFLVEFEVQLPGKNKKSPVSVVYQVPLESGTMNPKAMVPRGTAHVRVYPDGNTKDDCLEAGKCNVGVVSMRPGLVDPSWAKGRPVFRKGRPAGII